MTMDRFARTVPKAALLTLLCCTLLAGCSNPKERRASLAFHAGAVRKTLAMVKRTVRLFKAGQLKEPGYDIPIALEALGNNLSGLPARIEKKATTRVEERKAAAVKAGEIFREIRPKLRSLKFDEAEANAKLDEIGALIDEVEKD